MRLQQKQWIFEWTLKVPESPMWLLSKDRSKDAEKSLQWLRGWTTPGTVRKEFTELQNYSEISNACASCARQSIKCIHPRPTFCDKLKELRRKRSLKPFILIVCLQFFVEFSGIMVWMPYIIQVLKAHGIPMQANVATVVLSGIGFFAHICLLLTVNIFGKRKICLGATAVVVFSCIGMSMILESWMSTTILLPKPIFLPKIILLPKTILLFNSLLVV